MWPVSGLVGKADSPPMKFYLLHGAAGIRPFFLFYTLHSPTPWTFGKILGIHFHLEGSHLFLRGSNVFGGFPTSLWNDGGGFHLLVDPYGLLNQIQGPYFHIFLQFHSIREY